MSIERNTFEIITTSTNIRLLFLLLEEMQVEQQFSPFIIRPKFAAQITKVTVHLSLSRYRSL